MQKQTETGKHVADAMSALIGKPLWTSRRAADMATFQFGARIKTNDIYGRPSEVGEYALHVQCSWRIVRGDEVVVGNGDLYYPAEFDDERGDEIPSDFDWNRDPNRRDTLLKSLFGAGRIEFVVQKIEPGAAGSFRIEFDQDLFLEVVPDNSLPSEHWRLLAPANDNSHFVVTGRGIAS